jgi:pimeloyl-ACP methyl ester carboxylesterase
LRSSSSEGKKAMSGIDDLMAESNERWASAARMAQGIADHGMGEAVKAYYMLYFPVGFASLILIGTAGGMLAFGGAGGEWSSYLAFGYVLALLGCLVGGLIYNAKKVRSAAELGRYNVLASLADHEQKHVRRQILGKAPVETEHLAVTRGAAVQLRKGLATQLILAPILPLAFVPQAVSGSSSIWWLMAIAIGAQAVATVFIVREFRRAGIFLKRTGEQTASQGG